MIRSARRARIGASRKIGEEQIWLGCLGKSGGDGFNGFVVQRLPFLLSSLLRTRLRSHPGLRARSQNGKNREKGLGRGMQTDLYSAGSLPVFRSLQAALRESHCGKEIEARSDRMRRAVHPRIQIGRWLPSRSMLRNRGNSNRPLANSRPCPPTAAQAQETRGPFAGRLAY